MKNLNKTIFALLFLLFSSLCVSAQKLPSVELDVSYKEGGTVQKLDLYLPAKKGFPTIVYTYGGGWHAGSGKSSKPIAEKLQQLGYGCALVTHRLSPQDVFPAHAEDVAAAFAWVKKNIASRGGNADKIILAGHSSGAQLSLIVATDPQYLAVYKLSAKDITALIGLSPPVDLEPRKDGEGFGDALMGGKGADAFKRDVALMKSASPIQHITKDLPPMLLVVGENDFPMLAGDAKAFAKKAEDLGKKVEVVIATGKDHMGVAAGMLDEKEQVLQEVLKFLRKIIS